MIKIDDIFNKNIITVKEGRQINRITEILIDKINYEMKYLVIEKLGKCLEFIDINSLSENNIIIQSEEKLQDLIQIKDKKNLIEYNKLKNLKIISEKGLEIGKIQAIFIRKEDGKITHFEIAETPISEHRILSRDGILSFGEDVIIVSETAVEISQIMKSKSGLMNVFKKFFFKTKKRSEKTKEKLGEIKNNIGQKAGELAEETKKTIDKAKPKVKEYSEKLKNIIKKNEKNG